MTGKGSAKGVRIGGRDPGTPNKRTLAQQFMAAQDGPQPLAGMIYTMRQQEKRLDKLYRAKAPDWKAIAALEELYTNTCAKAAPYVHNRLAVLAVAPLQPGRLTLEDLVTSTMKTIAPANANMPEAQGSTPEASDGDFGNVTLDELFDGNTIEGTVKKG